ncbi:hypothetical protein VNI00_014995 [Paramarasmius palmivorus]|uniref:Uncharacterized protein n=1 Tax=Paramarasmius palmivorus TaxID=297713 RepID=A0AAW0BNP1_9AGAR
MAFLSNGNHIHGYLPPTEMKPSSVSYFSPAAAPESIMLDVMGDDTDVTRHITYKQFILVFYRGNAVHPEMILEQWLPLRYHVKFGNFHMIESGFEDFFDEAAESFLNQRLLSFAVAKDQVLQSLGSPLCCTDMDIPDMSAYQYSELEEADFESVGSQGAGDQEQREGENDDDDEEQQTDMELDD